jgi:hypothetical protein
MRPISDKLRLSNGVGAIITTDLYKQMEAHARKDHTPISTTICNALEHYLNNTDKLHPPANLRSLVTPETLARFRRDRTTNATVNPKTYPDLRDRLDIFAKANRLQASTVIRRAIYEYTKPTHPDFVPDPVVLLDAWGDRPKSQ